MRSSPRRSQPDAFSDLDDIERRIEALERSLILENWHVVGTGGEPAFQNSWVNGDGGTSSRPARFFKTSTGIVYLSGYISTGVAGTVAFTLPAGYRMVTGSSSGVSLPIIQAGTGAAGYVDLNPTGDVTPSVTPAFLDGVAFRGEQ